MRVLNAIRQWYRETRRGGYDWFSAPGRRGRIAYMTAGPDNSRGAQPEILIPDFSSPDDFTPALYANLCAFDVRDLGFDVRMQQWGSGAANATGQCGHVRLVYAFPNFRRPAKAIELDQGDARNRPLPISPYEWQLEGRQKALFMFHQRLYAHRGEDLSFEHVTMRAFTPNLTAAPLTFLDFWRGQHRLYCIAQFSIDAFQLQAVLSGFDEEEAVEMMNRLIPMTGDARLVEWHADASGRLRSEIDSFLGRRREQAGE